MPHSYEDFMKKAHGALILERENEIILELRATRKFLEQNMNSGFEEINSRIDSVESSLKTVDNKLQNIESLIKELISK